MEAIAHDYAPKGVKFYYIYKSLAHPESGGYVKPHTLKERLMHVREAQQRIAGEIPWLCDSIGNDVMHALGNAPTSEFVIDPDGQIVRRRAWGNARELRKDLEKLVGPVENPTSADDLDLKIAPPPKVAPRGVVQRIKVPSSMKPLVTRPESKKRRHSALRQAARRHGRTVAKYGKGKTLPRFPPRSDLPSSLEQLDRPDSRGDRISPGRHDA